MPSYLSLINYTKDGIANMKQSPARLEKARQVFKSLGGELKEFYLVMGRYDAMVICEGPNDETMMKAAMTIAGAGAVRTESMRIFNEDECKKILDGLP